MLDRKLVCGGVRGGDDACRVSRYVTIMITLKVLHTVHVSIIYCNDIVTTHRSIRGPDLCPKTE